MKNEVPSTRSNIIITQATKSAGKASSAITVAVKIPQTDQGNADDVFALDYDDNGLSDFVVLNGRKGRGPVQLLAAFPD